MRRVDRRPAPGIFRRMWILAFLAVVAIAILIGAFRIILGWLLSPAALARFDAAIGRAVTMFGKLLIVGAAGVILWIIWGAWSGKF